MNRLSANNLIQPITKDIELQDKTPFLLYKTKEILGIWFYEAANCKKLYQIISQVMNKMSNNASSSSKANPDLISSSSKTNENGGSTKISTDGASLVDLLNNAGKSKAEKSAVQGSPSGGEKLLRLLSSQPPEDKPAAPAPNGNTVAAFFAQVSQSSTMPVAASAPAPAPNPLQSLLAKPGAVSLQALENNDKPMPPLPSHAKTASDLESDIKTKKSPQKKATSTITTTPKSTKVKPVIKEENANGSSTVSYASVAKTTSQPPQPQAAPPKQQQPAPPQIDEKPQLMSPMVFAGAGQVQQSSPVVAPQPLLPPVVPMNGFSSPSKPQITPLNEAQLLQVSNC